MDHVGRLAVGDKLLKHGTADGKADPEGPADKTLQTARRISGQVIIGSLSCA